LNKQQMSAQKLFSGSFRHLLGLILLVSLTACEFSLAADITPPPGYKPPDLEATVEITSAPLFPLVPPDPLKGELTFAEKCAPCHGASGLGNGPRAVDLPNPVIAIGSLDIAREAIPAEWFKIVTEGNLERFMPPFQSLSDRQRWDVVAYSLSMTTSSQSILQGKEIFKENCTGCHGDLGKGDGPDAIGQNIPDFTDQEYMAKRSADEFFQTISQGIEPGMPAYADKLSEDERWLLTEYIRSLAFSFATTQESPESAPAPTSIGQSSEVLTMTATSEITSTDSISASIGLGAITGFIMNASGGDTPAELEINLHAFDQMQVVFTTTTTLKQDGTFNFDQIEMPDGRAFLATIEYDGVLYGSDIAMAEEGNRDLQLPIQVFEATTDTSNLIVDRLHYFFESLGEDRLRVVELYVISNPANRTVVAPEEDQPVLTYELPADATNLEFQDGALGGRFVLTEDGFGETLPVRPGMGKYQLIFSYEIPFIRKLEFTRPVNLTTDAIVILVPEEGINIEGDTIQDAGIREVQGVRYKMYNGANVSAGGSLQFSISGQAVSPLTRITSGSNENLLIGLGTFGFVLILAGIWLFIRNQKTNRREIHPSITVPSLSPADSETTIDAIIALDDLYQQGELPEEAYQQRRAQLKERLKVTFEKEDQLGDG